MNPIHFLFAIHNHQPVGNFEWVFNDAVKYCYEPFLDTLSRHPKIRLTLHHTGSLLEWLEENRPDYLKKLKNLSDRNQIELMGGAFYEPLISTLSEEDALGQIEMMNQYLFEKFGKKPKGMWLAERVWEPQLASIIHQSGIEYTLLDDTHFYYAGLQEKDMFGHYVTEDKGKTLSVFPIHKGLRYLIPFNTPEKTIEFLASVSSHLGDRGITLGDDGEKLGLWPGTYKWVFEEKYLDRLFNLLEENAHWIKMTPFSEYLETHPPMGRTYLPNASYEEMMEWSLPTKAQKLYEGTLQDLKNSGRYEALRPFLRGGFWRNFFSKYPESNLMHKKMTHVSRMVSKIHDAKEKEKAQKELWKGECNCPYWHGLFGGLYLNYLRHANYTHLIKAEDIALKTHKGRLHLENLDYNCDGKDEILLSTKNFNLYLQPHEGGSVCELDYRPKHFNLTNVLTRREESYHEKIAHAEKEKQQTGGGQPKSIHDISTVKEEGLEQFLFYDWYTRFSFLDHLIHPATTLQQFYECRFREEGDFVNQPYTTEKIEKRENQVSIALKREGHLFREGFPPHPLTIRKTFSHDSKSHDSFQIHYRVTSSENQTAEIWFGTELNLTLLCGNDAKRYYRFNSQKPHVLLGAKGEMATCERVEMVNDEDHFTIQISSSPPTTVWYFPLETISQSESGFERTYQGSCILLLWKTLLSPQIPFEASIEFSVTSR
ncbi:MAG: DUF1926 domain-containing protein [Chlamydiae bacterium]|nr:DUF1926 domain-containing protein [Chlamydiota bacterium]MBI3265922.1 DUF1926 domain-containing protein [Chlamydiota bacterium]